MPVNTGAACLIDAACPIVPMPTRSAVCGVETISGGVNDLYFIPCDSVMSEANILDIAWWQALVTAAKLGNIGLGIGSIGKKSDKKDKLGSCRPEEVVSMTWALKYILKVFDKTSADITTLQLNAILKRYNTFQVIARMCDGTDTVLPIGTFSVSDFNWIVPESNEDNQSAEFEISWVEFAKPKMYTVAGLSAVVPKA
ncbi:MAG: hypothetical protein WKF88_09355 [Ferruginibacter sp.]